MTPENVCGKKAITTECKILVFLQYLANKNTMREICTLFGISEGTIQPLLRQVSSAVSNLRSTVITWPTQEEQAVISAAFFEERGVPHVIGAIDGTHIELEFKLNHDISYINRKGYPSMLLQVKHFESVLSCLSVHDRTILLFKKCCIMGNYFHLSIPPFQLVVDHRTLIRHVHTGWPGCVHDARMYRHSSIGVELLKPECHLVFGNGFIIGKTYFPIT